MEGKDGPCARDDASFALAEELREAVLRDTKKLGRRLRLDEAVDRYGHRGAKAEAILQSLAERGLLARAAKPTGLGAILESFDAESLGKDIGNLVGGIVHGIEQAVEQGKKSETAAKREKPLSRREVRKAIAAELAEGETGKWDKKLMDSDGWKPGEEELSRDFYSYKDKLQSNCRKKKNGFIALLLPFALVNAALWYLKLGPGLGWFFPADLGIPGFLSSMRWLPVMTAGWGMGVLSSLMSALRSHAKHKEIEAMPELEAEQLALYKKLNRMKDSMAHDTATSLMVPAFLATINFIVGHAFPWFIIPSAFILIDLLSHLAAYRISKPAVERKLLDSLGVRGSWKSLFSGAAPRRSQAFGAEEERELGPYARFYREALEARDAIARDTIASDALASGGCSSGAARGEKPDSEFAAALDGQLGLIRRLAMAANELDRVMESIPMEALAKDKLGLAARRDEALSDSLKKEYEKSIAEIEGQEKAHRELCEQSELLRLRLGSSVNQLKRMRLDAVRLKSRAEQDPASELEDPHGESGGLARYIEDLRGGYEELAIDPFAELEKKEKARKAKPGTSEADST